MKDLVGWLSSALLLVTFGSQTFMQWKEKDGKTDGYTIVFFVAAILGTAGNIAYSWMTHNLVFTLLNITLVINNVVGLVIVLRRRARKKREESA
jgi:uncharacterized protein with PQ loop repeat